MMQRRCMSVFSIYTGSLIATLALLGGLFGWPLAAHANERVAHTPGRNGETWRIDEPNVRQHMTPYTNIRFQPGDHVTITAGGCVQTGGAGRTWKRYVDPQGPNADHLYHGLIQIPGVTQDLVRIASVLGRLLTVPSNLPPVELYLRLGYEDDNYDDNGYWGHDDGTGNQCRGVGPAFVVVQRQHAPPLPPPQTAPFDLVWDTVDDNGIPKNPKWGAQVTQAGAPPDPGQCNNQPDRPPCTTQPASRDYGAQYLLVHCGPHINWFPGTYEGTILWDGHSTPGTDDDYNFHLQRPDRAGYTIHDGAGLELEFDSDETIDHFHTSWWNAFHSAVDDGDTQARQLVNGKFAIVTGLVGLDCAHSCGAELHPVWAMAIRVKDDPADEVWAIFVRNWGNEGFCGTHQHLLPLTSYTFRLPWRPGASQVRVLPPPPNVRWFLTNDSSATGPNVTYAVNEGVLVNFTLSQPREDGTRINGELHLQWSGAQVRPVQLPARAVVAVPSAPREPEEKIEHRLAALIAQMTPEQRQVFLTRLPKKTTEPDQVVPRHKEAAVAGRRLPVLRRLPASQVPRVQAVNAVRKVAQDQQRHEAWCAAFGGNIPGFPNACTPSHPSPR